MTYQPEDQIDCQTFLGDLKIKGSISITDLSPRKVVQTFASTIMRFYHQRYTTSLLSTLWHLNTLALQCFTKLMTNDLTQIHKGMVQYTYLLHTDWGSDNLWPAIMDYRHMTSGLKGLFKNSVAENYIKMKINKSRGLICLCRSVRAFRIKNVIHIKCSVDLVIKFHGWFAI